MATRRKDHFSKKASHGGYPARSVYKLEEIDRRVGLFKSGMRVLDLGAAPGSWTMYAAQKVGPSGHVLGVDLTPVNITLPTHARTEVGDAFALDLSAFATPFDVVISDMAPKTTGKRDVDQYRSYELVMRAAEVADRVLNPQGSFVAKIFQGAEFDAARAHLRTLFEKVRVIRPKATRDVSYEVFLVGLNKREVKEV